MNKNIPKESGVIGVRQKYKRDGKMESEKDAKATAPGKPSTPQRH